MTSIEISVLVRKHVKDIVDWEVRSNRATGVVVFVMDHEAVLWRVEVEPEDRSWSGKICDKIVNRPARVTVLRIG